MTYCVWIWCLHIHVHNTFNFLGNYGLGQNKMEQQTPSSPPPNQGWSRTKAITPHFRILDFGRRGGINFPFILSKIVASALYNIVWLSYFGQKHFSFVFAAPTIQGSTVLKEIRSVCTKCGCLIYIFCRVFNESRKLAVNHNFQLIKIMQNCNIAEYQEPCIRLYTTIWTWTILEKMVVITSLPIHEINQINFPWSTYREPTHKCT